MSWTFGIKLRYTLHQRVTESGSVLQHARHNDLKTFLQQFGSNPFTGKLYPYFLDKVQCYNVKHGNFLLKMLTSYLLKISAVANIHTK